MKAPNFGAFWLVVKASVFNPRLMHYNFIMEQNAAGLNQSGITTKSLKSRIHRINKVAALLLLVALVSAVITSSRGIGLMLGLAVIVVILGLLWLDRQEVANEANKNSFLRFNQWLNLLPFLGASLVGAIALQKLSFGIISILWVLAAGLLIWSLWLRLKLNSQNTLNDLNQPKVAGKEIRVLLIGGALCLLSMFMTWFEVALPGSTLGLSMGSFNNPFTGNLDNLSSFSASPLPGGEIVLRGFTMNYSVWITAIIIFLILIAVNQIQAAGSLKFLRTNFVIWILLVMILIWWLWFGLNNFYQSGWDLHLGPWVFLAGLCLIVYHCFAARIDNTKL